MQLSVIVEEVEAEVFQFEQALSVLRVITLLVVYVLDEVVVDVFVVFVPTES